MRERMRNKGLHHEYVGKCGVHDEEVDERCDELCGDDHDEWQHLGHEVHDVGHIAEEAVHHVAAVIAFDALPSCLEQSGEEVLLHLVLAPDAQHGRYPGVGCIAQEVAHHDCYVYGSSRHEFALALACRYVGELAQQFHSVEAQHHLHQSHHNVDDGLHAASAVVAPQPRHDAAGGLFGSVEFHRFSLPSMPHIIFCLRVEKKVWPTWVITFTLYGASRIRRSMLSR